jgi:hypothetical protein
MNRFLLLAVPLAAALLFAGCEGARTTLVSTSPEVTGISVTGHGEVEAPPDTGFFDVGVQVSAPTVAAARDGAASAADRVISALKKDGVDAKDIQTQNFSISPEYDYSKNSSRPTIVGYQVSNTVSVKVRKLDNFSKIVDDASAAGGDAVRLSGIRFGIEDDKKLLDQARAAAMEDAKQKADQLARLGGVKLGPPQTISESQTTRPPQTFGVAEKGAGDVSIPTPIEAGTGKVTVDLSIRWAITSTN